MSVEQPPDFFLSDEAECRKLGIEGNRLLFPEHNDSVGMAVARSICADCVFIEPCKEYGMAHLADAGFFGGLDQHERQLLHRKIQRVQKGRRCEGVEPEW